MVCEGVACCFAYACSVCWHSVVVVEGQYPTRRGTALGEIKVVADHVHVLELLFYVDHSFEFVSCTKLQHVSLVGVLA